MAALLDALNEVTDWLRCVFSWLQDNSWVVIALLTLALVYFTRQLARTTHLLYRATQDNAKAADTGAKNTQKIDRAFVALSHTPDGMHADKTGRFRVRIQVHNHGPTPANVTNIMVKPVLPPKTKKLPAKPNYKSAPREKRSSAQSEKRSVFLQAGKDIFLDRSSACLGRNWLRFRTALAISISLVMPTTWTFLAKVIVQAMQGNTTRIFQKATTSFFDVPADYNYDRSYGRRRLN